MTLREPAAKVFSQYVHLWSEGRETLPFEDAFAASAARRAAGFSAMFDYEAGGRYAEAVARYLATFGRDRVHVVLFEELVNAPAAIAGLEAFLGVPLPPGLPHSNVGGRLRSPLLAALPAAPPCGRCAAPCRRRCGCGSARRCGGGRGWRSPSWRRPPPRSRRRRFAPDVVELERLLGRPTGWPAA